MFIEAEGGRAFAIRKQAAKSVLHPSCTGPLPFVTIYEPLGLGPDTDLSTVQTRATAIRTAVAQRGLPPVRFVVTDTLAQNMTGDADNNADTTAFLRAFRAFLRMLSEGPVFGLLIHHPGHKEKDRGRGAYALPADLDLILHLEGDLRALTLTCDRMRDGERFSPIMFALEKRGVEVHGESLFDHRGRLESTLVVVSRGGESTEAPRFESVETRILDHLQEHPRQSTTQISKDLAMKKATVVQKVDALKLAGRVTLISLTTQSGQTRQLYEVAPVPEARDDL